MTLSTHVLDTETGRPVAGLRVLVARRGQRGWREVASAATDAGGRATGLVTADEWSAGFWKLTFSTVDHHGNDAFYPEVDIKFRTVDSAHHHIPLLLSRHGFTTYRGS